MRAILRWSVAGFLLAVAVAAAQQPRPREGELKEGAVAPDFALKDPLGKQAVKLSDLKGKPVVLLFGSCT